MLFNTVEELKAVLPSVHQQNSGSLLGFAATAELLHLVPVLGAGLVEQLGSLPGDGSAPAHLLALRAHVRRPLAYYALLEAAPILAVTLNDLGATESSAGTAAPSRQWVYNNFVEATAALADKLLDQALAWLDLHAAVFTQELLDTLRAGLASGQAPSAEAQALLKLVRPVLAHRALAQGILSLSVALTGTTLRLLSDNEAVRQRQAASPKALSVLSQQAHAAADRYQAKLATYLDARQPAPAAPVAAELYDNAGKPSFWV